MKSMPMWERRSYSSGPHQVECEGGFSVVEMLITLFVTSVFLLSFYTLFDTINLSASVTQQQAIATGLAHDDLAYYIANSQYYNWPTCNNTTDLSTTPTAAGVVVDNGTISGYQLPAPAAYVTTAYYPEGCTADAPIMYKVVLTWGPYNYSVTRSAYVAN